MSLMAYAVQTTVRPIKDFKIIKTTQIFSFLRKNNPDIFLFKLGILVKININIEQTATNSSIKE